MLNVRETFVQSLKTHFSVQETQDLNTCLDILNHHASQLLLVDYGGISALGGLKSTLQALRIVHRTIPIILLFDEATTKEKVQCFEIGYDDCIDYSIDEEELYARLNRTIFNKIANDQLLNRINEANELAFIAMSDTSDLGVNVQYLLDCMNCNTMDELALRFHKALDAYSLNGSLQIRSQYGVRNFERHGMSKDLEAQLLTELKDNGRFIPFGQRLVMNYGKVSLLIKNMPVDEAVKYGAIQDNLFSLLQGANSRIEALDNQKSLHSEREIIEKMTGKVQSLLIGLEEKYQKIIAGMSSSMDKMAESMDESISYMGLHEEQEKVIERLIQRTSDEMNDLFKKGFQLDENFNALIYEMNKIYNQSTKKLTPEEVEKLLKYLSS